MSPAYLESHLWAATLYAMGLYGVMWAAAAFLLARFNAVAVAVTPPKGRYGALDGFRGVLAIGVFVHHSFASYGYFANGKWAWSTSAVLIHLGQTTVGLFFMITGFLFTLKAVAPVMRWREFFFSRAARLVPLYTVVVSVVFLTVAVLTWGRRAEPASTLLGEASMWLSFTIFGEPDINGYPETWTIIAGVIWTLKYEVLFYLFGVPAIYLGSRMISPRIRLALAVAVLAALLVYRVVTNQSNGDTVRLTYFICGAVAALVYKQPRLFDMVRTPVFRVLAGASVLLLYTKPDAYGALQIVVALMLFAAASGGLSIFGLLQTRAALWLGDISYGIYLIHGFVLWLVLSTLRSTGHLAAMGLPEYCVLMAVVGCFVVALASLSYIKLERPVMAKTRGYTSALRSPTDAVPSS